MGKKVGVGVRATSDRGAYLTRSARFFIMDKSPAGVCSLLFLLAQHRGCDTPGLSDELGQTRWVEEEARGRQPRCVTLRAILQGFDRQEE